MHIAFLDVVDAAIEAMVQERVPRGSTIAFAAERTADARAAVLGAADVAFVIAAPIDAALIAQAPRLRFIQKLGAGIDRVDLAACRRRGITLARLAASNAVPVAEHTVLLMLAVLRRLPLMDAHTRAGHWDKEAGRARNQHLRGKTIGLLGCGAIGRTVAEILAGFKVDVIYFDPVRLPPEQEARLGLRYAAQDELLRTADVVSLHLPLTAETQKFIDREKLAMMKPSAVLINCARGAIVDEGALADALKSGRLAGAGLDVFATEPPAGSPLLGLDNVVVTPHFAGATLNNFANVLDRAFRNALAHAEGRALPGGDVVLASTDQR
ncbi:MAG: 2-hydroxyacid dehydrogenase [Variibacter sp.]